RPSSLWSRRRGRVAETHCEEARTGQLRRQCAEFSNRYGAGGTQSRAPRAESDARHAERDPEVPVPTRSQGSKEEQEVGRLQVRRVLSTLGARASAWR